jgi:hypothetical protein
MTLVFLLLTLPAYKKLTGKQKPNKKQTTKTAIKHQAANQKNNLFSLGVLLLSCSTGVLFSGAVACVLVGFFIWV